MDKDKKGAEYKNQYPNLKLYTTKKNIEDTLSSLESGKENILMLLDNQIDRCGAR